VVASIKFIEGYWFGSVGEVLVGSVSGNFCSAEGDHVAHRQVLLASDPYVACPKFRVPVRCLRGSVVPN
jgi:hypothetical protein